MAALLVMRLLSADQIGAALPFAAADLPAILAGATAFSIVNEGVVAVAVALYQRVPVAQYLRRDVWFVIGASGVVLFLAPIVAAAASYSAALLPLFVPLILGMYYAGRQAVGSEHAARHDSLTRLANRNAFKTAVTIALDDHRPSCVLLMDLDHFKDVNDALGHDYGDLLLQRVARRLAGRVGEHVLARLGGDEFAILGLNCDREASKRLAESVAGCLRAPFELDQVILDAQASIGIALFPDNGSDVETLLQRADVAMYHAKEAHSGIQIYQPEHDHHSPAKLALTADLRSAIESDQIVVYYQPELDLASDTVNAVEALVRWQHPDLGLLAPGSFLDMAEHTNLIHALTHKVLALALAQVAQWRADGIDITVAVNISTRVLIDPDFANHILHALRLASVPANRLKLEVTESALMADPAGALAVLQQLDRVGVQLSIDDFGTGYSSLAYLARLPATEVKIDRSFVSRMSTEPSEAIIVSSTIELAHHLGLRAVAEGIEDLDLLPKLHALGCDTVQGYGISPPIPAAKATEWLLSSQRSAATARPQPRAA